MTLPTFEEIRRQAFALLDDVEDELRLDCSAIGAPTADQHAAPREVLERVAGAKVALDRAVG